MGGKILITARSFWRAEGLHPHLLRDAGYELVAGNPDRPLREEELLPLVHDVVAVILGVDPFTGDVMRRAPQLRVISRCGAGVDNVHVAAATTLGIVVTNTPDANSISVAELTMGLMLALARAIPAQDRNVREGRWDRLPGAELQGQTLGLLGFGRIGREVARRALAFGMQIAYHDKAQPPGDLARSLGARAMDRDDVLATSDVVSLHLPLTAETRHIIDGRALKRMKPTAFLINTGRGGLVDEAALARALKEGWIAGAAADVFEREPPGPSPLFELASFIASPHTGGVTRQSSLRMGLEAAKNALAVLSGERPENVVNPEVYDHPRPIPEGAGGKRIRRPGRSDE